MPRAKPVLNQHHPLHLPSRTIIQQPSPNQAGYVNQLQIIVSPSKKSQIIVSTKKTDDGCEIGEKAVGEGSSVRDVGEGAHLGS
jgi:hypothetical protein